MLTRFRRSDTFGENPPPHSTPAHQPRSTPRLACPAQRVAGRQPRMQPLQVGRGRQSDVRAGGKEAGSHGRWTATCRPQICNTGAPMKLPAGPGSISLSPESKGGWPGQLDVREADRSGDAWESASAGWK